MPAGDLITADFQFELRALLTGAGTDYEIGPRPARIAGFGRAAPKTSDVELDLQAGSYAGPDYAASRLITIPYEIVIPNNAPTAMARFDSLSNAWAESTTDIALYFRLPHWGKRYVMGRPRGLAEDFGDLDVGIVRVLATFFAPDPTISV